MADFENSTMEMDQEVEVIDNDDDMDVVDMDDMNVSGNSGMIKTAAKAVGGLVLAVGGIFGIRHVVKKHGKGGKYIESTPNGLVRCK
jgi:hypothetical protein